MHFIKNKELSFEEYNRIIMEEDQNNHGFIAFDTCKFIAKANDYKLFGGTEAFIIGDNCRIDLREHNEIDLVDMSITNSHILHQGIVKIINGLYSNLSFTSINSQRIKELYVSDDTYIDLIYGEETKLYIENFYGTNENILDAIIHTMEHEKRMTPCYHIKINNKFREKNAEIYIVNIDKIYKDEDHDLTSHTDKLCTAKITDFQSKHENMYTVEFVNELPQFSIITKLFPLLKEDKPIHIISDNPVIIDIDDFKTNFPNVVIINSVENKVLNCEKDVKELLTKYSKEMISFYLEGE